MEGPAEGVGTPEPAPAPVHPPRAAWPVHPLLVAAYPILALYARNLGQITVAEVLRPLGAAVAAACIAWLVMALLTRSAHKGAVVASAAVLAFFSYGHARNLAPAAVHALLPALFVIGVAAVVVAVWRRAGSLASATVPLNLASLVLVAPSCWAIGAGLRPSRPSRLPVATPAALSPVREVRPIEPAVAAAKPDIYYVVLDAYGREDSLRAFMGVDNSAFLGELRKRGFMVADHSTANYNQTPLCMASALNMEYLDGLASRMGPTSTETEPLRVRIDRCRVAAELKRQGYRYIYVWTGAGQTRVETADLVLDADSRVSAFEGQVLGLSALDARPSSGASAYQRHRREITAAFDHLAAVPRLPGRKFVVAHIMAPHPPFVFGPNGEEADTDLPFTGDDASWLLGMITPARYRKGYADQLAYINRRTLAVIDAIRSRSKTPPVIVVQGDHGSRMTMDWDTVDRTDVRECFSILNAYHVPEAVRGALYPEVSPVNTFRIVLARLFGLKMGLLPDRSYYSSAWTPYALQDVTERIPRAWQGPPPPAPTTGPMERGGPAPGAGASGGRGPGRLQDHVETAGG